MTREELDMHMHVFNNAFRGIFKNGNREPAVREYVKQLRGMCEEQGLDFDQLVQDSVNQEDPNEI